MARAIDGKLLELEIANIANKLAKSDAQKALMGRVMYYVEHMPTLTPPNEPLTLEQLRKMDGEPVFLVFMQPIEYGWEDQWALVDSENETVFNGTYKFDFSDCVGFAYRRPPEVSP